MRAGAEAGLRNTHTQSHTHTHTHINTTTTATTTMCLARVLTPPVCVLVFAVFCGAVMKTSRRGFSAGEDYVGFSDGASDSDVDL